MENKKKKERGVLLLLIVAVLLMTIGFALYTQTLNINGTVTVKGSPWNVHYVENSITPTDGSVTATNPTIDKTNFKFTVTLEKPGDFYEATINVINDGSMDAILKKVTMGLTAKDNDNATVTSTDLEKYFTYTITYNNGTSYSTTTEGLETSLPKNTTHPVKVKVTYVQPTDADDLPKKDVTVTVTGNLDYESAT